VSDQPDTFVDVAALIDLLDLDDFTTRDELIARLQERRGHQADSLAARMPDEMPTATTVRLRASQRGEVELCERALDALGAPYVAPNIEEDE
jgi:hypothetical protein